MIHLVKVYRLELLCEARLNQVLVAPTVVIRATIIWVQHLCPAISIMLLLRTAILLPLLPTLPLSFIISHQLLELALRASGWLLIGARAQGW